MEVLLTLRRIGKDLENGLNGGHMTDLGTVGGKQVVVIDKLGDLPVSMGRKGRLDSGVKDAFAAGKLLHGIDELAERQRRV